MTVDGRSGRQSSLDMYFRGSYEGKLAGITSSDMDVAEGVTTKQDSQQLNGMKKYATILMESGASDREGERLAQGSIKGMVVRNAKYWLTVVRAEWPRFQAASWQKCDQLWRWTLDGSHWRHILMATVRNRMERRG